MDDSEFAKGWEGTRSRGFARFVVVEGATFGICFAVTIAVPISEWLTTFDRLHVLAAFAGCMALGCLTASLVWQWRENRDKRFIEASPSE